jgi:hypothetical protein
MDAVGAGDVSRYNSGSNKLMRFLAAPQYRNKVTTASSRFFFKGANLQYLWLLFSNNIVCYRYRYSFWIRIRRYRYRTVFRKRTRIMRYKRMWNYFGSGSPTLGRPIKNGNLCQLLEGLILTMTPQRSGLEPAPLL